MNRDAEWLETDGLGGFAFGRADGMRTRRYHALLTVATTPPTGRFVLVNGVEAWVETAGGQYALSSQRYVPDVTHPDGADRLLDFSHEPWPTWTYRLPSGEEVIQELVMLHGASLVAMSWRMAKPGNACLRVRPLLSGRDAHSTHHENGAFRFDAAVDGPRVTWRPYEDVPPVIAVANADYIPDAVWYRRFQYDEERARGLDFVEDLASPGSFVYALTERRSVLALGSGTLEVASPLNSSAERCWSSVEKSERRRRAQFSTPLQRAADSYIVRRGEGCTIVAGYPWFSDWGRDTFIAVRGLCLTGDRLHDGKSILLEWSRHVSEGMLPNFFPEGGVSAEYNSVDASLWYVLAVHDLFSHPDVRLTASDRSALQDATDAIVAGYAGGTRFGIRADDTGLLSAGAPGVQLTWMDAKIGDWVVTPRIGKPVEIQALWINALRIAGARSPRWAALAERAHAAFIERFWNEGEGSLHDVVDADHIAGNTDVSFRPNQIFAVGGLPFPIIEGQRARRIVDSVERRLWTPAGLRTLASDERGYIPRYEGDTRTRDASYHQGTVWPWLMGAFIDAWVRVRGGTAEARREARSGFLEPLLAHYAGSGPGQIAEIADADPPHAPRGCPFQAWSVGEALRLDRTLLEPTADQATHESSLAAHGR